MFWLPANASNCPALGLGWQQTITSWALAAFAVGLPSFVLIKVFQPAFFAREDTKTPMWFAMINLVVNAAGSLALFFGLQSLGMQPHTGIAVATTISGWINALLLWGALKRRGHFALDARTVRVLPLLLVSSLVMGVVLVFLVSWTRPLMGAPFPMVARAGVLAGLVAAGMMVFAGIAVTTGALKPRAFQAAFRRGGMG